MIIIQNIKINVFEGLTVMRYFYTWDTCCIKYRSLFLPATFVSTIRSFILFLAIFNVTHRSIVCRCAITIIW